MEKEEQVEQVEQQQLQQLHQHQQKQQMKKEVISKGCQKMFKETVAKSCQQLIIGVTNSLIVLYEGQIKLNLNGSSDLYRDKINQMIDFNTETMKTLDQDIINKPIQEIKSREKKRKEREEERENIFGEQQPQSQDKKQRVEQLTTELEQEKQRVITLQDTVKTLEKKKTTKKK